MQPAYFNRRKAIRFLAFPVFFSKKVRFPINPMRRLMKTATDFCPKPKIWKCVRSEVVLKTPRNTKSLQHKSGVFNLVSPDHFKIEHNLS